MTPERNKVDTFQIERRFRGGSHTPQATILFSLGSTTTVTRPETKKLALKIKVKKFRLLAQSVTSTLRSRSYQMNQLLLEGKLQKGRGSHGRRY
jgi:hypothetical protein